MNGQVWVMIHKYTQVLQRVVKYTVQDVLAIQWHEGRDMRPC